MYVSKCTCTLMQVVRMEGGIELCIWSVGFSASFCGGLLLSISVSHHHMLFYYLENSLWNFFILCFCRVSGKPLKLFWTIFKWRLSLGTLFGLFCCLFVPTCKVKNWWLPKANRPICPGWVLVAHASQYENMVCSGNVLVRCIGAGQFAGLKSTDCLPERQPRLKGPQES